MVSQELDSFPETESDASFEGLRNLKDHYEGRVDLVVLCAYRKLEKINPNSRLLKYFKDDKQSRSLRYPDDSNVTVEFYENYGNQLAGDGRDQVKYLNDLFKAIGDARGRPYVVRAPMQQLLSAYLKAAEEFEQENEARSHELL